MLILSAIFSLVVSLSSHAASTYPYKGGLNWAEPNKSQLTSDNELNVEIEESGILLPLNPNEVEHDPNNPLG